MAILKEYKQLPTHFHIDGGYSTPFRLIFEYKTLFGLITKTIQIIDYVNFYSNIKERIDKYDKLIKNKTQIKIRKS